MSSQFFTGNVDVIGTLTAQSDLMVTNNTQVDGEILTSNIRPSLPNGDLVILANGIQNFDIQTAATKSNLLEINELAVNTVANIQLDNSILPNANNTLDLGSIGLGFANVYSHALGGNNYSLSDAGSNININNVTSFSANSDLVLSGNGTGGVLIPDVLTVQNTIAMSGGQTMQTNGVTSFSANQNLNLSANGTGRIEIASGKPLIPQTDNSSGIGSSILAFYDLWVNHININLKANYNQITNINTAVSITGAESSFQITTQTASTASTATDQFTVNNSNVFLNSYVFCQVSAYSGVPFTNGEPHIEIDNILAGSFRVNIRNYGGSALSGTFILRFNIV